MDKKLVRVPFIAAVMSTAMSVSGAESLPWSESFSSAESFGKFTVIDVNDDGRQWERNSYNECARMTYNDELAMDDWLITPGFELEAGRKYKFSLDAKSYMGAERFEVKAGLAPDVSSMTVAVIEPTVVTKTTFTTYSGELTPAVSGVYYIGIHGCSDPDKLYLDVDNLELSEGMSGNSPAAVSGLTAVADPMGLPKVTVSFRLPVVTAGGSALSAVDRVDIIRDGLVVASETGHLPGDDVVWSDEDAPNGNHIYKVIAYGGGERGLEAECAVFVGPRRPAPVGGFKARETEDGLVELTWDVPLDADGNQINPALITYKVVQNVPFSGSLFTEEDIEGADALTQTSFTHRAVSAGAGQIFTSYGVYASTAAGRSAVVKLPLFPVGSSYATPWRESFAGGRFSSLMRSETVAYQQIATSWDIYTDAALADVKSVDGDNGFIVMAGSAQGDCARLYSGKINLEGVVAPALTFYLYNNSGNIVNNNLIEVYACGDDGSGFSYVGGTTVSSLPVPGWNRVTVPLVRFAGATMQFALQGTLESYNTIFVDDIRIASRADRDMAATALVMPGNVVAGVPFEIGVVVENRGARAASGWSVTLSRDGVDVATVDGSVLAAGNTRAVAIADCISVLNDAGKAVYTASVSYEDDANESDNCTDAVELSFEAPRHPAPFALTGSQCDGVVTLSWSEPDVESAAPDAVTESFEDYAPFAKSDIGGWTMVDVDQCQSGKLAGITFPGINDNVQGGQTASFWILDSTYDGLDGKNATFAPPTGDKCLVQIFNYNDLPCDDWAISPELYGGPQQMSFQARAYSQFVDEDMEVLYSTTGTAIADFISLGSEKVANAWTSYCYQLPEGARYFAIRCTTEGGFMLMVDDVTFIPAGGNSTLELKGYNVYRNGVCVTSQPVDALVYSDRPSAVGQYTYHVTAVYDRGESVPAGPVEVETDRVGLGSVRHTTIDIAVCEGEIVIAGADGVTVDVYSTDGRHVAAPSAAPEVRVRVPHGVYLVKAGTEVSKVVVR